MTGLTQPLEKAWHGKRIVAGARQGGDADAVGLFLVVAGEIDPPLHGQALDTGDGRRSGIDVHLGAEDGGRDHQQGGGNGELLLVLQGAQQVALADVGDLVGEDRGELGFRLRRSHQAGKDANMSIGAGEGVDCRLIDEKEAVTPATGLGGGQQALTEVFQIVRQQGIIQHRQRLAHAAHEGLAELALLGPGHEGVRRAAKIRQADGLFR